MKHAKKFLFALAPLVALALISVVFAKDRPKPRESHTYFSATGQYPPSPFHPFPGLPTSALNNRAFVYNDSKLDYAAIRQAVKESIAEAKLQSGAALLSERGGGGSMALLSSTGLRLAPPALDGSNTLVAVLGAEAEAQYDLFHTTNLLAWQWLGRGAPGQTNFVFANLPQPAGFFILGTMQDSDADTLTDAFENLVTQTSAFAANDPASLGANSNLLVDLPSALRVKDFHSVDAFIQEGDPCPVQTSFAKVYNSIDWTNGMGGLDDTTYVNLDCGGGNLILTTDYWQFQWDTNGAVRYRDAGENHVWSDWSDSGSTPAPPASEWLHRAVVETTPTPLGFNDVRTNASQTRVEYRTGGKQFAAPALYKITATATEHYLNQGDWRSRTTNVPPERIRILGQNLDTNGNLYVVWGPRMTNDLTPTLPMQYTNYQFTVNVTKVLVALVFRTSGSLTALDTNGVGYGFTPYLTVTSFFGNVLGTRLGPMRGDYYNLAELSAVLPTVPSFPSAWDWHRDRAVLRYLWEANSQTLVLYDAKLYSGAPPGNGNDSNGGADDDIPDDNQQIFNADAPTLDVLDSRLASASVGSIAALRFTAKEWLTWQGGLASDILYWHSYVTIKKVFDAGGVQIWIFVGKNEIKEGEELNEFTSQEAQGL